MSDMYENDFEDDIEEGLDEDFEETDDEEGFEEGYDSDDEEDEEDDSVDEEPEFDEDEEESTSDEESEYEDEVEADSGERTDFLMRLTSDAFTRRPEKIKISQIGFTDPIKKGRQNTITGLTKTVHDLGVLQPIHVMTVPEESEDENYRYVLLDGVRRIFGALRNGQDEIDAIVWDFKDKDQGVDLALYISLLLNRTEHRSWAEIWHLYQVLELQSSVTPATLEYLLQLESGDAMKLKDVMLCSYEEVKQALLNNEKNLEACYKMLAKLRKEEDRLAMEDVTGTEESVEGAEELKADNTGDRGSLSEQDVLELMEMADTDVDELGDEDFGELNQGVFDDEHQVVGERHIVDPAIKQGTFNRDGYKCRCCGIGGVAFLGTLIYHHLIPVSCKGADSVENGLTLCESCHISLHVFQRSGGKVPMTQEQYDEYTDEQKDRIKRIIKYARVAVEAGVRAGKSREDIAKEANDSIVHRMPGEGLKENQQGFAQYQRNSAVRGNDNEGV